jgi:hypothetical protein
MLYGYILATTRPAVAAVLSPMTPMGVSRDLMTNTPLSSWRLTGKTVSHAGGYRGLEHPS